MKEPAQIVCGEGPARLEGSGGPDRTGRATATPARLEDEDLVETVSRAILRELEGGVAIDRITTGVIAVPSPCPPAL